MTGLHLSHYRIDDELGRGGMGIVYKATDTKLNRTVALKVLPAAALSSDDDRARFFREAQAAAQLHHPNIATVFGIDEAVPHKEGQEPQPGTEARLFIAMEFIEGETLSDYIKKGPVKLTEAVSIAGQVSEALKEAHAKDIVHRDIKSANVMLTADGIAKVLDFGLAKTNASTMLTRMGSTLGTVAYMSPEQARGNAVDGRTDLYSLGTMLYEMVAGKLPFAGDYEQAVLYSILNEPPEPLTAIRTGVPMDLERVVGKLLSKEAEYRYQSAAGLLADLKSLDLTGSGVSRRSMPAMPAATGTARQTRMPVWVWGIVALATVLGAAIGWFSRPRPAVTDRPVVRFDIEIESRLNRTGRHAVAVSPNGSQFAYIAMDGVRLRQMESASSSTLLLPGGDARELFYSPDGRWLAYEESDNDWLMKLDLSGGAPTRIADKPDSGIFGASWADDGMIYVGLGTLGMARVPDSGGILDVFAAPDPVGRFHGPQLLPDGDTVLYTYRGEGEWDEAEIRLLTISSGESRMLFAGGRDARYIQTGHILYLWQGSLYAMPFDPRSNEATGGPVPVAANIEDAGGTTGAAQFGISGNGTLVSYRRGDYSVEARLEWLLPDGTLEPLSPDVRDWSDMRISPDGRKVAAEVGTFDYERILVLDGTRGTSTEIGTGGASWDPVWDPTNSRIAYLAMRPGMSIVSHSLDDPSDVDTLLNDFGVPQDWSRDGRLIAYIDGGRLSNNIKILDVETGEATVFLASDADTDSPVFSPDGQWIAYDEGAVGAEHVFVRRFPSGADLRQVSIEQGVQPQWSADGRTLYYATFPGRIRFRSFDPDTGELSDVDDVRVPSAARLSSDFAVHPDGRLLVANRGGASEEPDDLGIYLDVVINFDSELRARVSSDR